MLFTIDQLYERYKGYTDINGKIGREVKSGRLIPVSRGLYEDDPNVDGSFLAAYIYGPSYLSFDFALSYYSLIPEATKRAYTSATFGKLKKKRYDNAFGRYSYRDVPSAAFPLGVESKIENGYSYLIATPEKAICDKLYTVSPVGNKPEFSALLFDDLRLDEGDLRNLTKADIAELCPLYRTTNLNYLLNLIKEL